jgi:heme A synthase
VTRPNIGERADYLSKRRARMLPFLAVIYLTQQATYISALQGDPHRTVEHVKIGAWLVLSAVILAALVTKGFWLQPRELRDLIDDESTRANRLEGIRWGFIAGMSAGMVAYLLAQFEPLTAGDVVHIVLTFGLGVALARFGILERRAHRDG